MSCCSYYGPFAVRARPGLGLAGEPGKEDRKEWDEQAQKALASRVCVWLGGGYTRFLGLPIIKCHELGGLEQQELIVLPFWKLQV